MDCVCLMRHDPERMDGGVGADSEGRRSGMEFEVCHRQLATEVIVLVAVEVLLKLL